MGRVGLADSRWRIFLRSIYLQRLDVCSVRGCFGRGAHRPRQPHWPTVVLALSRALVFSCCTLCSALVLCWFTSSSACCCTSSCTAPHAVAPDAERITAMQRASTFFFTILLISGRPRGSSCCLKSFPGVGAAQTRLRHEEGLGRWDGACGPLYNSSAKGFQETLTVPSLASVSSRATTSPS